MLKILHIAPINFAGVPYDFYQMHNACGDYSRIITLHQNERVFPEDICLNLPMPNHKFVKILKRKKVSELESTDRNKAHYFIPKNLFEHVYYKLYDFLAKPKIEKAISGFNLDDFDIIHYDGGLDFYRDAQQAIKWKKQGKKIVCCYFGSDLRVRGLIKELDETSDLNITSEFDHLALKKDLEYLFYPYDTSELPQKKERISEAIRIIHSPTNRKYKGTELIISVIEKIKRERNIEFLIMENVERNKLLEIKSQCDISIDQVGGTMGGTGYGKAGLETLAMGIPTITNMTKEYTDWLKENPFIVANNSDELYKSLIELIDNEKERIEIGKKGIAWINKYHSFESVNKRLNQLYQQYGITST
ncbi:MAG: glycosyltransferase [Ignavibacteriaceae bacterium]|jgi:glycosyltransferase involved in cell wall biosynthesis|nr:glycosyltransferase [Ignavibacteriaceae bacterium]